MLKSVCKRIIKKLVRYSYPIIDQIENSCEIESIRVSCSGTTKGCNTKLYGPYHIFDSQIGDYTYISMNSWISHTSIGKFCSIGPNFICGWGIHPTNSISTSPMFYSTLKQNGFTLSVVDKIRERKPITIGNDVFIGANVMILDGVNVADGAVIGAGAVVVEDVPPYAIVGGVPAKVIKYRFCSYSIQKLEGIRWWDWDLDQLKNVEKMFYDVDGFIKKYSQNESTINNNY